MEQILGFTYTACFIACYWPQIIKCYRNKSVKDVSLSLFLLSVIGYLAAIGYVLISVGFDFWLLINYSLSLLSAVIMLLVWFKYR